MAFCGYCSTFHLQKKSKSIGEVVPESRFIICSDWHRCAQGKTSDIGEIIGQNIGKGCQGKAYLRCTFTRWIGEMVSAVACLGSIISSGYTVNDCFRISFVSRNLCRLTPSHREIERRKSSSARPRKSS